MRILINSCNDCPFHHKNYDDFSSGFVKTRTCKLAKIANLSNNIISVETSTKQPAREYGKAHIETFLPEWCPLKKDEYTFYMFNNEQFGKNVIDETDKIKENIESLKEANNQLQKLLSQLKNID